MFDFISLSPDSNPDFPIYAVGAVTAFLFSIYVYRFYFPEQTRFIHPPIQPTHPYVASHSLFKKKSFKPQKLSFSDRLKKIGYEESIPEHYTDPETNEMMNNPVFCDDGYTHDEATVKKHNAHWRKINRNPHSHFQKLTIYSLNQQVKSSIEHFVTEKETAYRIKREKRNI